MTYHNALETLAERGLRIADQNEKGWCWVYINQHGERITLWVTDNE